MKYTYNRSFSPPALVIPVVIVFGFSRWGQDRWTRGLMDAPSPP
ncbi:MAG: hypothetical protein Q6373_010930 [Candidatus Sigynarchaeota archaeon]